MNCINQSNLCSVQAPTNTSNAREPEEIIYNCLLIGAICTIACITQCARYDGELITNLNVYYILRVPVTVGL